jgi:hypothetical protein
VVENPRAVSDAWLDPLLALLDICFNSSHGWQRAGDTRPLSGWGTLTANTDYALAA